MCAPCADGQKSRQHHPRPDSDGVAQQEQSEWSGDKGKVVKRRPERGPPCERSNHCVHETLLHNQGCVMLPSLLWNSQRARECGQSARERSEKGFPLRSVETRLPKNSPTRCSGAEDHCVSNSWVTCVDHPETVCPAGPVCWDPNSSGAPQTTSSHLEW